MGLCGAPTSRFTLGAKEEVWKQSQGKGELRASSRLFTLHLQSSSRSLALVPAEAPCRVLGPAPGDVGSGHLSLNSGGTALGIQSPAAPLALSSACPRCSSLRGNQSGHLDTLDSTIGWQIRVLLCAVTRNEEVVGTMERIDLEVDACGSHTGLFGVCVGGCSLEQGVKSQETVSRGLKSLLRHPPSQGPACTGH